MVQLDKDDFSFTALFYNLLQRKRYTEFILQKAGDCIITNDIQ